MFYVFKKNQVFLFAVLVLLIFAALSLAALSSEGDYEFCRRFLSDLGYEPYPEPYEISETLIPEGFGTQYDAYNALNKRAGFDLTPLRGTYVTRVSFRLVSDEPLYANLLVHNFKICGGDICNPSLSGFMMPLKKAEDSSGDTQNKGG